MPTYRYQSAVFVHATSGLPTMRELNDLVPRDVPCRNVAFGSGL
jgi:hypothetical protein